MPATSPTDPELTVDIRLFERGMLKAFADVTIPSAIGELPLRGFRVLQKDGEGAWVAFPSSSYTKDGKIINNPLINVSGSAKKRICEAVLAAYELAKKQQ